MWDTVLLIVLFASCWLFCFWSGFRLGIKYERMLIEKEEVVYLDELPEGDAQYWKRMYEALSEEWNEAHGWKSMPMPDLTEEKEDAPGETTE